MIDNILRHYTIHLDLRHETKTRKRRNQLMTRRTVEINNAPKRIRIYFREEEPQPVEVRQDAPDLMEMEPEDDEPQPMEIQAEDPQVILRLPRALFHIYPDGADD